MKLKVDLSKYDNSWYRPGSAIKRGLWYLILQLFFKNGFFPFVAPKRTMLRMFGARLGKGVIIKPSVNIKYPWNLSIGDYSWIGERVWIDNLGQVEIGSNCCLSQGCMLLTGNHDYSKSTFDLMVGEIALKNGVWIGARALVGPGCIAETHAVLAVESVAPQTMEAYSIYRGNPAQKIKDREVS